MTPPDLRQPSDKLRDLREAQGEAMSSFRARVRVRTVEKWGAVIALALEEGLLAGDFAGRFASSSCRSARQMLLTIGTAVAKPAKASIGG